MDDMNKMLKLCVFTLALLISGFSGTADARIGDVYVQLLLNPVCLYTQEIFWWYDLNCGE